MGIPFEASQLGTLPGPSRIAGALRSNNAFCNWECVLGPSRTAMGSPVDALAPRRPNAIVTEQRRNLNFRPSVDPRRAVE